MRQATFVVARAERWYDTSPVSMKGQGAMVTVQLDDDLAAILGREVGSLDRVAREMIVFELYRRETISQGRAAELLGMPLDEFIKHASSLGIPSIDMTPEELDADLVLIRSLGGQ
jgi:predicted HTH domain antitoxin